MKREFGDFINPVLIKELRQYLHNRLLLMVMGGMLLLQLLTLLVFSEINVQGEIDSGGGFAVFYSVCLIMGTASFLVVSVGGMVRFLAERADTELDFSRVSVLTPGMIVRGKMAGATLMLLFIFALCLPFVVIAYFLRGVSMLQMLITCAQLFVTLLMLTQLALLAGATGRRWIVIIYVLVLLQMTVPLAFFIIFPLIEPIWIQQVVKFIFFFGIFCQLVMIGIGFFMTTALISPPNSNRIFPLRILFTILLLIGSAGIIRGFGLPPGDQMSPFYIAAGSLMMVAAIGGTATLASFERDAAGRRVCRSCPRNPVLRTLHFLYSSGWPGGIMLALLLALAMTALRYTLGVNETESTEFRVLINFTTLGNLLIFYAALALLLHRISGRLPGWGWWLITSSVCSILPYLLNLEPLKYLSVFSILGNWIDNLEEAGFVISAFLAMASVAVLVPAIIAAFHAHHAPAPENTDE